MVLLQDCQLPSILILAGRPDFQPICTTSWHDPHRDAYVPIFWSEKLVIRLKVCGLIERQQKVLKRSIETFLHSFLCPYCSGATCSASDKHRLWLIFFTYFSTLSTTSADGYLHVSWQSHRLIGMHDYCLIFTWNKLQRNPQHNADYHHHHHHQQQLTFLEWTK